VPTDDKEVLVRRAKLAKAHFVGAFAFGDDFVFGFHRTTYFTPDNSHIAD
jgi:hypothetical protein